MTVCGAGRPSVPPPPFFALRPVDGTTPCRFCPRASSAQPTGSRQRHLCRHRNTVRLGRVDPMFRMRRGCGVEWRSSEWSGGRRRLRFWRGRFTKTFGAMGSVEPIEADRSRFQSCAVVAIGPIGSMVSKVSVVACTAHQHRRVHVANSCRRRKAPPFTVPEQRPGSGLLTRGALTGRDSPAVEPRWICPALESLGWLWTDGEGPIRADLF